MSERFLCIHGHFYQPARENPWLGAVLQQESAAPYHDWNERITAECYARNGAAHILDPTERVVDIVNNYASISFNVGPTLLRWLARHAKPTVYAQILEADRESQQKNAGHGNAIAQVYNHVIMPLASHRDRTTQVIWGIRDFERHFQRRPEGMWLPETAVDLQALEVLATHGMTFTILAPHQAMRVRPSPSSPWRDVRPETLDVTVPYRCALPSGHAITIFFYDAPLSRGIAFEGLLGSGAELARRLVARVGDSTQRTRILTVATDGESFGHHHPFGEMALAYALHDVATHSAVRLTNFGAYLAGHPPSAEVELRENSSWSCTHGIERWRADCGCNSGKGWHQQWRGPLREAITWLSSELDALYQARGAELFVDPWAARDDALDLLEGTPGAMDTFFARHASRPLAPGEHVAALRLLEMQRQGLLMQSSDGWFFDDISGTETIQILAHATRAMELGRNFGAELEGPFAERLRAARGNLDQYPNGTAVLEQRVRPMAVSLARLVGTHAMRTLVEKVPDQYTLYQSAVRQVSRRDVMAKDQTLSLGRVGVRSTVTDEEEKAGYAVVHFDVDQMHCALRTGGPTEEDAAAEATLVDRFKRDAALAVIPLLDAAFGPTSFVFQDLLPDDRHRILSHLGEQWLADLERFYRRVYDDYRTQHPSGRGAQRSSSPALRTALALVLTRDLEQALSAEGSPSARPFQIVAELGSWGLPVPPARFEPLLRRALEAALAREALVAVRVLQAGQLLDLAEAANVPLNLREAQNQFARLIRSGAADGNLAEIRAFGERLRFNLDAFMRNAALPGRSR